MAYLVTRVNLDFLLTDRQQQNLQDLFWFYFGFIVVLIRGHSGFFQGLSRFY